MKSTSTPPFRMKAESRVIDLKEKYAPNERPDFTTSKKMTKRRIRPAAVDKASALLNCADNGRRVSVAKPLLESNRGNIARSYTYESILYDQIVSLESFLIIAKAASTGHDIDEVLSCVGSRARESVDDDLKRYEGQLEASQGQSDTHRHAPHVSVAAFDHISNKLCGRMEFFLFNEKKERLLQENTKEEERRNAERQIREDSQASQMADDEVRMQELITRNESLQSELHSAEKQLETLKIVLDDTIAANVPVQQLLVEMRIQGLDFKCEVDRRCRHVLSVIEAQLGYLPGAVERQLLVLLNLLPPGDPKYDTARILGDPRSLKKLRVINSQNESDLNVDKWLEAVSESKNKIEIKNKTMSKMNIERKKIKHDSLSSPLSRGASAKMNIQTKNKLLAHGLGSDSLLENKKKIGNNFLQFEKLLKCSTIEEKRTKKKDLTSYGEKKIIRKVSNKKQFNDFTSDFNSEINPTMNIFTNTKMNSKSRSKKNRSSQISLGRSAGSENVHFNGRDTSYEEFRNSVNLLRDNIVKGTKAARTDTGHRTDTTGYMDLTREGEVGEGKGVEERKSDCDGESHSAPSQRSFSHSDTDMDLNRSRGGISGPESVNYSLRDMLMDSYNTSLHDSMIDTYDAYSSVCTAESLNFKNSHAGVTMSYLVPPSSTFTSIPITMSNQVRIRSEEGSYRDVEAEAEEVSNRERGGERVSNTQSKTVSSTETETGKGPGAGIGVKERYGKAERSPADWMAWARRGSRMPLSESIAEIVSTNTYLKAHPKGENDPEDSGSKAEIQDTVSYHEDFLPVFSTKVIDSHHTINQTECDNIDEEEEEEVRQAIIANKDENDGEEDALEDDNFKTKEDKYEKEEKEEKNHDNDNDEDDMLVYDMPQYYDDYYASSRVMENDIDYLNSFSLRNDNTAQLLNPKEYNQETPFETVTEMNIYTESDERDPYAMSSEPYKFLHGIRNKDVSSSGNENENYEGDDSYRIAGKAEGKVVHRGREESYLLNKGIAFPLRGPRTDSETEIGNAELSDLSGYRGPSAAIPESYMKGVRRQSPH